MCNRCMYRRDGDDGVDWQPIHVGIVNFKRPRKREKSPNWAALRGLEMSGFKNETRRFQDAEPIEYEEGKQYTARELEQLAEQMLREDAKAIDPETGKPRGIGGRDPILFAEHEYARRRREIYNENGVPDPGIVRGIYGRTHPNGRKVNSDEQRKKNGASFYRN